MPDTTFIQRRDPDFQRHFRRYLRKAVDLKARVEILTGKGHTYTSGTAIVRDVSLKGARLGGFSLKKSSFPAAPFVIRLQVTSEKFSSLGGICRPVRFGHGDEFELAVEFEDLWIGTRP